MSQTFEEEDGLPEQEAIGICFPQDQNTTTIEGFIGGEAHASYLLHLIKGRKLTLKIDSADNAASFGVSKSEFGEPVDFGTSSDEGRSWTGVIPETAVYFISITAFPDADYKLKVTVE